MRVIEVFSGPVRAVAVSPDGRYLAAASGYVCGVFDLLAGDQIRSLELNEPEIQPVFTGDPALVIAGRTGLLRTDLVRGTMVRVAGGPFSGGVATSPDGKTLVATRDGPHQGVKLEQWDLVGWQAKPSFDYWSPFLRLAFSANGESLAGINRHCFELRYAHSGGLNKNVFAAQLLADPARFRRPNRGVPAPRNALLSFSRYGETVVFGWDTEFRVMETHAGNILRWVTSPGESFVDVAFLGSGRILATVDGTPTMRIWSAETWEVIREYDWGAGALSCVTASPDGLAGVCGSDAGRVVVFDVDE
jgi:WD40 repeat protein